MTTSDEEAIRFDFTLTGTGWATATIGQNKLEVALIVSYLHDSRVQLADAIL